MSSMGSDWPDDDMPDDGMNGTEWSFLGSDPGPSSPPAGIIPVTVTSPQTPSIIPVPSEQDQSAVFVPHSAYGSPPLLQNPDAVAAPVHGAPSAEGIGKAFSYTEQAQDVATEAAKLIAELGGGEQGALRGLAGASHYLTRPLAAAAITANTIADLNRGASPIDAFVGNAVRAGLVYGGGALVGAATAPTPLGGLPGVATSIALDNSLPSGAVIGHAILNPPTPDQDAVNAMYHLNM